MKTHFHCLIFIILLMLNACNLNKPNFNDLIGSWTSDKGGLIILKMDSSCIVKDIYPHADFNKEKVSFEGRWSFREKDDTNQALYNINIKSANNDIYLVYYISTEELLNDKNWHFFQPIGDPDELIRYNFYKQN